MPLVWDLFNDYLFLGQKLYGLKIHSFVLMTNHFHLLVSAPQLNLSQAMNYILRELSKQILTENERINSTFKKPFFRSRIRSFHHYTTVYKYIYRNPVEAGACEKVEDYPFSSLSGLIGKSKLLTPLEEDTLFFDGSFEKNLIWLNEDPHEGYRDAVRKGLRRSEFNLPKLNSCEHPLNHTRY